MLKTAIMTAVNMSDVDIIDLIEEMLEDEFELDKEDVQI